MTDSKELSKSNLRPIASFSPPPPFLVLLWGNYLENIEGEKWFYQQKLKVHIQIKPPPFFPSHWYLLGTQRLLDWRQDSCSNKAIFHVLLEISEHIFLP